MSIDPLWQTHAQTLTFQPGEFIFREHDPSSALYLISEGQVAIIRGADSPSPTVLGYRGADALLGEVGMLNDAPRTASVFAVSPTTVVVVDKRSFWGLFDHQPVFRHMVLQSVIERLIAADDSRVRAAAAERHLFERLESLSSENDRLDEVVQLRQETMRFIVHDLRNPLNLMVMALSLIETDEGYAGDAESRRFLSMAHAAVQRMFALVESLLDVERLEAGRASLMLDTLDVQQVIDDTVGQYLPIAQGSSVSIVVRHHDDPLPPLVADRARLERVLTNLIDNGLKFSPEGGTLTISTARAAGGVQVAVTDEGPGIPDDVRGRVFDRFVQVSRRRDGTRGFGLGLAYCHTAVTAHGGRIWVEVGEKGRGSRFVFTLPLRQPTGEAEPVSAA